MGIQAGINFDSYPEQGTWVGKRVSVCYEYDASRKHSGVIVRDDETAPFQTIIQLDNGRFLLTTECMYSLER